jgi:hypothetical protein
MNLSLRIDRMSSSASTIKSRPSRQQTSSRSVNLLAKQATWLGSMAAPHLSLLPRNAAGRCKPLCHSFGCILCPNVLRHRAHGARVIRQHHCGGLAGAAAHDRRGGATVNSPFRQARQGGQSTHVSRNGMASAGALAPIARRPAARLAWIAVKPYSVSTRATRFCVVCRGSTQTARRPFVNSAHPH